MSDLHKPRIAFLIPRLGITDRGAEVFVFELIKRLRKNFSVTVFTRANTSNNSSLLSELELYSEISICHITSPPTSITLLKLLSRFKKLEVFVTRLHIDPTELEMLLFSLFCLPRLFGKFDLLFPVNGIWGAIICRIIRRINGIPFVYSSQGGIEPLIARQKPNIYFSIHPSTAVWLHTYFPKLRVIYIPNGVDLKRFSPKGKKAHLDLPRPIFITVAALISSKQVDLTIHAVAQLKRGSLVILGEGILKNELLQLALQKLGPHRFKLLSVSNLQVPEYLRAADVFTLAAPWEVGIGLVQSEAMACGLPIVSNNESTIVQMLGKAGMVCDVRNSSEYSLTLKMVSQKHFGNAPRLQAHRYSWNKIAKKYSTHLFRLVSLIN